MLQRMTTCASTLVMNNNEPQIRRTNAVVLSIITPAYNEAENLPSLYERLVKVMDGLAVSWEWVIVDDHSHDQTFKVIQALADSDLRIRGIRFSRNFGSHIAMIAGMELSQGSASVIMASDLQDPPEVIPNLLDKWSEGNAVVYAVRENREGHKGSAALFSRFYYFLMREIIGFKEMPATGADFFLLDRKVMNELVQLKEINLSILPLITWMGFTQASVAYTKQARQRGRSGWNFAKKLKVVIDSVTAFSYLPVRIMSATGFLVALLGFVYSGVVIYSAFTGTPPQGWASLMVVVAVLGGVQMMMIGVLGEYVWRALDESRRRPRYIIEACCGTMPRSSERIG